MIFKDLSPVVERLSALVPAGNLNDQAKQVYDSLLKNSDEFQIASGSSGGVSPGEHIWRTLISQATTLTTKWYTVDEITTIPMTSLTDALVKLMVPYMNDGDVWIPVAESLFEWLEQEELMLVCERGDGIALMGILTRTAADTYTLTISPDNQLGDQPPYAIIAMNADSSKMGIITYQGLQSITWKYRGLDMYSAGETTVASEWAKMYVDLPPGTSVRISNFRTLNYMSFVQMYVTANGEFTLTRSATDHTISFVTFE